MQPYIKAIKILPLSCQYLLNSLINWAALEIAETLNPIDGCGWTDWTKDNWNHASWQMDREICSDVQMNHWLQVAVFAGWWMNEEINGWMHQCSGSNERNSTLAPQSADGLNPPILSSLYVAVGETTIVPMHRVLCFSKPSHHYYCRCFCFH